VKRSHQRGFTLLELIVAASILALVAVFAWRGLDQLIREREALAASQATIDALQRSFARIEHDALVARDAELDGEGRLRLVAGNANADPGTNPTVEYRVEDGALLRIVAGVDRAPLVMLNGVASLAIEAWTPAPNGGRWVRTKGMAMEPSRPATSATGGAIAPTAPGTVAPPGTPPNGNPNGAVLPGIPANAVASVPAATGVRFAIGFADGTGIVRAFMIGGA
jgi:general secretion pathway protein J